MKPHVVALMARYAAVRSASGKPVADRMDWAAELRLQYLRAGAVGRRRLRREWRWAVDGRAVP